MRLRKQLMEERLFDDAVGLVLDALPALIAHDVLLIREVGLIDLVEEIAHAIGLEPQGEFEAVGRHGLEVIGPVEVGGAVHAAARPAPSSDLKCVSPGTCFDPWNIMCSKRCAKPVRPGSSLAGPT